MRRSVGDFKYYVGLSSLAQIATRKDRVCVLNILGGESSDVTPVGHEYSGGNVVFGTSPGRRGQSLETRLGPIPVYNNVLEGLSDGHRFNCGVVYLPPAAARDGVAELIRVNPDLEKIFIVTEKMSVHDAREIRSMAQHNGIDIFGANSLGVADAWNRVRIGGALGGDNPAESLKQGSIAIHSNSGNFSSTIATYLRMGGWGTTTIISSGKDVYIHYAAPEFAFALANDARSRAAVLYVEPGGYYELDAQFTKPVVACVVGRWKAQLTRAVGHAGAMAGGDDDALAKERWFMERFGVSALYTPERPVHSARGAVVTNIAHIVPALTAVMRENAARPDFEPEGSTGLKPWFASNAGLRLPREMDVAPVAAIAPYNEQIRELDRQLGAALPRQGMKNASGASQMDPRTQVTLLHGVPMLSSAQNPLESNLCLALLHEAGGENDRALINVATAACINLHGDPALAAAQAARNAGNAPNTVMAAAISVLGPQRADPARRAVQKLIETFADTRLGDARDEGFEPADKRDAAARQAFLGEGRDARAEAMLEALRARGAKSTFIRYLQSLGGHPTADAVLAAIVTTAAWAPLMRRRISTLTVLNLPWWMRIIGGLIGASVPAESHEPERYCGFANHDLMSGWSLTEIAALSLLARKPEPAHLFGLQTLVGLLLSNGPGTISAQGAKGAVAADGPESPERVQLNKAIIGFLTHSGYSHGGNGYEGIAFLIEQFRGTALIDAGDPDHGLDLKSMAAQYVARYAEYKSRTKALGSLDVHKIPGVHHPVFRDRAVNHDPREVFIAELFRKRGEYNVFHEYYRALVHALYDAGLTRNVYCVNIDAVIAALLLKMMWRPFRAGAFTEASLESAAFTVFLYGRMIGCAAEIEDHLNRGRNMDTRTPASECRFVA